MMVQHLKRRPLSRYLKDLNTARPIARIAVNYSIALPSFATAK